MRADNYTYSKTSLYFRDDLKEKIHELVPNKKQSDFINEAVAQVIDNIERECLRQELLKSLKEIKPVKRKETARQTLEKLRKERDNQLFGSLKSTKKTRKL